MPISSDSDRENFSRALEEALGTQNFVLAESLARRLGRPETEVKELQKKALRPYILEFRNPQGMAVLLEDFHLSPGEVKEVVEGILQEVGKEGRREKGLGRKRFDVETMGYLGLEEWIKRNTGQ